jgi:hypothetical protein
MSIISPICIESDDESNDTIDNKDNISSEDEVSIIQHNVVVIKQSIPSHSDNSIANQNYNNANIWRNQAQSKDTGNGTYRQGEDGYFFYKPFPGAEYISLSTITFNLINTKEFAIRSDNGYIPMGIIDHLKMIPGVNFDWKNYRWVFSISQHETLKILLCEHKLNVVPLPRGLIVAAQILTKREDAAKLAASDVEGNSYLDTWQKLMDGGMPEYVIYNLAEFQKDAVCFVQSNNGRALIADEMGLGKTRSAIACSVLYKEDWPVLVICPSTAR